MFFINVFFGFLALSSFGLQLDSKEILALVTLLAKLTRKEKKTQEMGKEERKGLYLIFYKRK